jgi:hypothetical protein
MFSRDQLKRAVSLTEDHFAQLGKCWRPHNRLGFADRQAIPITRHFVAPIDRIAARIQFYLLTLMR